MSPPRSSNAHVGNNADDMHRDEELSVAGSPQGAESWPEACASCARTLSTLSFGVSLTRHSESSGSPDIHALCFLSWALCSLGEKCHALRYDVVIAQEKNKNAQQGLIEPEMLTDHSYDANEGVKEESNNNHSMI